MRFLLFIVIFFLSIASATAEENQRKTLLELQTEEFLLEGTMWERIERATLRKKLQCMRSFPHEAFCECLASKMPMAINMIQYVVVTTVSREDFGYDSISEDERKAVDVTIQAREDCVSVID